MPNIGWIVLCSVFCVISCIPHGEAELLSVIQIFRHGQRVPINFYPNDPYKNKTFWGANPGQLVKDGKKQAYDLGVYTRKKYENFLPSIYSEEDFYAYTTDVDRTHMSAQAYIAGLYPPSETDQWSNQIHWQPIPVHPLPNHLLEIKNCPVYFDTVAKSLDEQFHQFISSNKDIVESVSKYAGLNSTDMTQLALVYDTLYIENIVGYPLPEWAKSVLSETFGELFTDFVGIHGYSDLLQRLANGPFLYTLVQKFEEKLQNPTTGPKLTVYSAHDINVLGLLRTFGHNYRPTFSSSIYFELWKLEETSYINVYFKNGDWVYPLQINGCDFNCTLNEFKNLMKNYIIDEQTFRKECFLDSDKSSSVSNCVVNESKKSLFENKGN